LLDTGYFGGLTNAYLNNDQRLTPFYNHYFEAENFEKAIEERINFETNSLTLAKVLDEQHAPYYSTFPYLENVVASLKDKHTFTITTGHQLCLATGPLYFIYKIASAINLSRKLKLKYPQYNFVPVYWMASEDHDFEEINHINLFNKKITWNAATSGATGRISNSGIETFLNDIKEILGDKINSTNLIDIIHDAYQKHSNLAEATRYLVLHLFAEHKLLVLNADNKLLKNEFKEIIKEDILGQVSNKAVLESINQIVSTGLVKEEKIQVKPRDINFFYLKDKLRKRITLEDQIYKVLDTEITFTEAQLLQEIDAFPEKGTVRQLMMMISAYYFERLQKRRPNLVIPFYRLFIQSTPDPENVYKSMDVLINPLMRAQARNQSGTMRIMDENEIRICLRASQAMIRNDFMERNPYFGTELHQRTVLDLLVRLFQK
jgi:bacillithiol biosynthesis cysteine-adding enzyme BshC